MSFALKLKFCSLNGHGIRQYSWCARFLSRPVLEHLLLKRHLFLMLYHALVLYQFSASHSYCAFPILSLYYFLRSSRVVRQLERSGIPVLSNSPNSKAEDTNISDPTVSFIDFNGNSKKKFNSSI